MSGKYGRLDIPWIGGIRPLLSIVHVAYWRADYTDLLTADNFLQLLIKPRKGE